MSESLWWNSTVRECTARFPRQDRCSSEAAAFLASPTRSTLVDRSVASVAAIQQTLGLVFRSRTQGRQREVRLNRESRCDSVRRPASSLSRSRERDPVIPDWLAPHHLHGARPPP